MIVPELSLRDDDTRESYNLRWDEYLRRELPARAAGGWFLFGYHSQFVPVPPLEFSEEMDDCGDPIWERRREADDGGAA